MTPEQFEKEIRAYLKQVLAGVCQYPNAIQFAVDIKESGIYVMAKVDPGDFARIKYEGVLDGAKTLTAHFGKLRRNDQNQGKPFVASLQLYNPSFDTKFTPEG